VLNEAVAALLYHSICLDREDLLKFKALKMVVRIGSVPDNVDVQAATELGSFITHLPSALSRA
jgi:C-terminal binding protein